MILVHSGLRSGASGVEEGGVLKGKEKKNWFLLKIILCLVYQWQKI